MLCSKKSPMMAKRKKAFKHCANCKTKMACKRAGKCVGKKK